ncbi:lasso peptide benenodin 1 [Asticcacaulis benevestitus]|uniref:Benenodin family lasso peptide n=1 Tax=Asticcacaulis benevestitus DSM 16100 = ATCC BAA-896 TaxID=1121022 RepID=V4RMX4_9CAUL|nr:lasso peptide benenodin 1 [Asticcacaulis benevestitus]ESQ92588.1 hypothetical protein ABENE_08090 [Asticcacaulis benevestitus DSM 16100 = ATCC BAA-896]
MEKIETHEDLIDLGAASSETKGVGFGRPDSILTQEQAKPMGLDRD